MYFDANFNLIFREHLVFGDSTISLANQFHPFANQVHALHTKFTHYCKQIHPFRDIARKQIWGDLKFSCSKPP